MKPTATWRRGGRRLPGRRDGVVLLIVMGLLSALILLAGIVFTVLSVDVRNAGSYTSTAQALAQADAGARYAFSRARADVAAGTLGFVRAGETVNYSAPAGFSFDAVTNLVRLADRRSYLIRVTGRSSGNARAVVEVVATGRAGAPSVSVFGNTRIDMKPGATIYSYRSGTVASPVPTSNTHEATVGTNGQLGGTQDAIQGGTISLGVSAAGVPASYAHEATTPATVEHVGAIDSDPLGVVGGYLARKFAQVALTNNNASVSGGTRHGAYLTIDKSLTLRAGDYYVDQIALGQSKAAVLTIDASAGPANIYLTGSVDVRQKAEIVVNPPRPNNFRIYSNSTQLISMKPKTSFMGFVYAPLATVDMSPNGNLYGSVWANVLTIMPGGQLYCDADLSTRVVPGELWVRSWKEVR